MTTATDFSSSPSTSLSENATFQQYVQKLQNPELSSYQLGILGEAAAKAWLGDHSWSILDSNWHSRYGEIDIIALTPHRTIVFVEVKTRRSTKYGLPEEAVHPHKQMNIRRAATQWLTECGRRIRHIGVRFDVITLLIHHPDVSIHHIPEAF